MSGHPLNNVCQNSSFIATNFLTTWFLEIALVRASICVCVSVCLPPRPLTTSDVIWCDKDCVRLVKQVLRLFPSFLTTSYGTCRR